MDLDFNLDALPPHELVDRFRALTGNNDFEDWLLDRSAQLIRAARAILSQATRERVGPVVSDVDLVVVRSCLGYGQTLKALHTRISIITQGMMVHNPGRTAAQVKQMPGWRRSVGCQLLSPVVGCEQEVIDAVSLGSLLFSIFLPPSLPRSPAELMLTTATDSRERCLRRDRAYMVCEDAWHNIVWFMTVPGTEMVRGQWTLSCAGNCRLRRQA